MGSEAGTPSAQPRSTSVKIPSAAEQRETYVAQLQPHVPEPILAIGFLTSVGYAAGLTADYAKGKAIGLLVSPMLGWLNRKQATNSRVDASRNDLVAVTATSIYRFEFPKRGEPFTVSTPIVWDRSEIVVTAGPKGKYAQPIHVAFVDGSSEDFDISNGARDYATFSDEMRDLLIGVTA